jgi:hypothetical protein
LLPGSSRHTPIVRASLPSTTYTDSPTGRFPR